jgi:hypothetical protein
MLCCHYFVAMELRLRNCVDIAAVKTGEVSRSSPLAGVKVSRGKRRARRLCTEGWLDLSASLAQDAVAAEKCQPRADFLREDCLPFAAELP